MVSIIACFVLPARDFKRPSHERNRAFRRAFCCCFSSLRCCFSASLRFSRFPCVVSRLPDGPVSAVLTLVRAACPPVAAHRRHFAFRRFGWRSLSFGFAGKKPMSAHNVPRNLSGCLCGGTKPCENLLPPVRAGRMCQASVPDKRN